MSRPATKQPGHRTCDTDRPPPTRSGGITGFSHSTPPSITTNTKLPIPASAQLPSRPPQNLLDLIVPARVASDAHAARPSGTVTFLFTDIEGSTRLCERHPDLMPAAFHQQEAILREAIAAHGGYAYKMVGDAFQAAFATAAAALSAALAAQRALAAEDWGALGSLRVRMALDSGVVEQRGDDYVGPLLNRVARLLATWYANQILLSAAAGELLWNQLPAHVSLRDLGVHQLKDITRAEQIFQAVAPGLSAEFPPLRTIVAQATPLPHPATPFIGRAAERAEISALLDDPACRLLTLSGPGGIGKTRLALALAAERLGRYPHGVWFANLAPLSSADGVVSAIADTFKLSGLGVVDPKEALRNYLREKALLLVLDNFEHVLEAAGLVAEILAAPGVQVLATSRERLRLRAERVYEVGGLPFPLDAARADADAFDALRLFVACVRHTHPQYTLDGADRVAVAQICRLAAGMPLGIELAAAWVPTLPVATIAAELAASLDLLETTMRDVPERQRSAGVLFEHSWELLTAEEQALFGQLSVFRGGFTFQFVSLDPQLLATLDALMGLATILASADDVERAVEVLTLVCSAARIDRRTETKAEQLLAELEGHLSLARFAAAQARGRALELGATVAAMLAEVAA